MCFSATGQNFDCLPKNRQTKQVNICFQFFPGGILNGFLLFVTNAKYVTVNFLILVLI